MRTQLDVSRLTELQQVLGSAQPEIVTILVTETESAIFEIESGIADGDLGSAGHAAHAARNVALMLDAQPMLEALAEIESSARGGDRGQATTTLQRLRLAWPELKRQLEEEVSRNNPR